MTDDSRVPLMDTSVSHSARVWNYWLGGKDHCPVDREVGDKVAEMYPDIVQLARAARGFLTRAFRYLAGEAGIRQFLDIGTGMPTVNNTHEVAQSIAPESRVVYVDNDPLVLTHARALLTSSPEGVTDYVDADLRDPETLLREAARTLDFARPVAITLIAILHHVADYDEARSIVNRLLDSVRSGSYLVISHSTNVIRGAVSDEAVARWNKFGKPPVVLRSPERIAAGNAGEAAGRRGRRAAGVAAQLVRCVLHRAKRRPASRSRPPRGTIALRAAQQGGVPSQGGGGHRAARLSLPA